MRASASQRIPTRVRKSSSFKCLDIGGGNFKHEFKVDGWQLSAKAKARGGTITQRTPREVGDLGHSEEVARSRGFALFTTT